MQRFLLDRSPTGVEHYAHVDDGELILEEFTPTSVDQAIVAECQRLRNHGEPNRKANFRLAASVPINLYQGWRKEWRLHWRDKYDWKTFLVTRLNDPDYKNLRIGVNKL